MATWVGPPASYTSGRPRPIQYVVIHATAGSEAPDSAEAGAQYDKIRTDGVSTHIFVDSNSAVREVRDGDQAHAAFAHANAIGLHVELCGGANQSDAQWHDSASWAELHLAAQEVAVMCADHGLEVRHMSVAQVRAAYYNSAGQRPTGICGHSDVTAAYPEDHGDHTDPGPGFPWSEFIQLVAAAGRPVTKRKRMRGYKASDNSTIYLGDGLVCRDNFSWAQFCYMVDLGLVEPPPPGQPTAGTDRYESMVWVLIPGQVENYAGRLLRDATTPGPGPAPSGPVDLTDAAVTKVSKATVNETYSRLAP